MDEYIRHENEVYLMDFNTPIDCLLAKKTTEDVDKALRNKPPPDFSKLPTWLQDFKPLFEPKNAEQLPPHRPGIDCKINLVPGAKLPCGRLYNMSRDELLVLEKYIKENLAKGFIRPSKLTTASPVLFV